jgi:hypothetical protein
VLSAGELGTNPEKLESALQKALTRCQLWNAVLLLDEDNVFMENRTSSDLERNELVSSMSLLNMRYRHDLHRLTGFLASLSPTALML